MADKASNAKRSLDAACSRSRGHANERCTAIPDQAMGAGQLPDLSIGVVMFDVEARDPYISVRTTDTKP